MGFALANDHESAYGQSALVTDCHFCRQPCHPFVCPIAACGHEGNIIHLPETQLFVAEACSGLRSLMALGTLASGYMWESIGSMQTFLFAAAISSIAFIVAVKGLPD